MELFGNGHKRKGEGLLGDNLDPATVQPDLDPDLMEYEVGERVMFHAGPEEIGLPAVIETVDGDDFYTIRYEELGIVDRHILNKFLRPINGSGQRKGVPEQRGREQASKVDPGVMDNMAHSLFGKGLDELTYDEYQDLMRALAGQNTDLKRVASDESHRIIIQHKIEQKNNPPDTNTYFIEGSLVDEELGEGLLPCRLDKREGDMSRVTVADGPFTGTKYTVPNRHLKVVEKSEYDSAAEDLFK